MTGSRSKMTVGRWAAGSAAVLLALGLAGCGGNDDGVQDSGAGSLEASMDTYAAAVASADCASAGSLAVGGTDANCESRPDHYAAPGYYKIGRIVQVDERRANVETVYRCESCSSEAGGFVRAVEDDGAWKIDYDYNDGSFIDDASALAGEG